MEERIAEAARTGGIDEDMHVDKAFAVIFLTPHVYKLANSPSQREQAPKIERSEQSLTTASSFEAITPGFPLISAADTIVTHYVQHLVLLAPPQAQLASPVKRFPPN